MAKDTPTWPALVRAAVTWLVARSTVTSAKGRWLVGRCGRVPGSWAGIACWPSAGGAVDPPVSWVSAQVWSRVGMFPGMEKSGCWKSNAAVRSPVTDARHGVMLTGLTPVQAARNRSIEVVVDVGVD